MSQQNLDLLKIAYEYARDNSTDQSTQNGAILMKNTHIVAYGANKFPTGVKETPERLKRPLKYQFFCHAESSAILDAAKNGISTNGLSMVACWAACSECAKTIIQAGIKHLITHKIPEHSSPKWQESIKIADIMFEEAGVLVDRVEGVVGIQVLFDGVLTNR